MDSANRKAWSQPKGVYPAAGETVSQELRSTLDRAGLCAQNVHRVGETRQCFPEDAVFGLNLKNGWNTHLFRPVVICETGRLLTPPRTLRMRQNQDPGPQKQGAPPTKKDGHHPPYPARPPPLPPQCALDRSHTEGLDALKTELEGLAYYPTDFFVSHLSIARMKVR